MSILEVSHIEKHFGGTSVLKDVSFSMEEGSTLAIIGSSGSGKTTLLRCLNFLEKPNQGTIAVKGEMLYDAANAKSERESELRRKRLHFGMVFQSFNLFPQYTALENVMLAERLLAEEQPDFKQNKKEIYAAIEEHGKQLLDRMGLSERMDHYPHQLSGGQQQRVAIARALAINPEVILFDEPTSALDPELTGEVLEVMRKLAYDGSTMVVITHEMEFARKVADWVVFMADGVVVEEGKPEEFFTNPQNERTIQFLRKTQCPES